ncbi:MAG: hypothetical protein FJ102_08960 [Deltaproteobacteria bacterium]|nr:hypothetical protein [Deltaproteobacteria bacterium]
MAASTEAEPAPRWRRRVEIALCLLIPLLVALAAMWPRVPGSGRFAYDLFSASQVVVAQDVAAWMRGAAPNLQHLDRLRFPDGAHVAQVGWPVMLVQVLAEPLLGAIDAFALAECLNLAAGGAILALALRDLGLRPAGYLVGGAIWASASPFLHFMANGQVENLVGAPLALGFWGACNRGPWAIPLQAVAGLAVGFSSPYHAIPAAMIAAGGVIAGRDRWRVLGAMAMAISMAPAAWWFSRPSMGIPPMGPGPSSDFFPLDLDGLVAWRLVGGWDRSLELLSRQASLWWRGVDATNVSFVNETMQTVHLGAPALALGGAGLLFSRRPALAVVVGLAAAGATLLAMGGRPFEVFGQHFVGPWPQLSMQGPLKRMGMTYRFVTGLALAQAVGVALLVDRLCVRGWLAPVMVAPPLAAHAVALLTAPFPLPLASIIPRLDEGYAAVPATGGVLDLPSAPARASRLELTADFPLLQMALHGRPSSYAPGGSLPRSLERSSLTMAAQGKEVSAPTLAAERARLASAGFRYVALHTGLVPGGARLRARLEEAWGPPDAEGRDVVGWVIGD